MTTAEAVFEPSIATDLAVVADPAARGELIRQQGPIST
jgi:hypothetical protein